MCYYKYTRSYIYCLYLCVWAPLWSGRRSDRQVRVFNTFRLWLLQCAPRATRQSPYQSHRTVLFVGPVWPRDAPFSPFRHLLSPFLSPITHSRFVPYLSLCLFWTLDDNSVARVASAPEKGKGKGKERHGGEIGNRERERERDRVYRGAEESLIDLWALKWVARYIWHADCACFSEKVSVAEISKENKKERNYSINIISII